MKFSNIEAQEGALTALRQSLKKFAVAHAYLFTGPKGCGKTTAACAFAASLNCTNPSDDDACGTCASCTRIQSGTDVDVRIICPDGSQTKIEQMQEMKHEMSFAPLSGKYKVFIIKQADTLNTSSENAILKILEEPPSYGMLILLSQNQNSLLQTIRSRCRFVRFRPAGKKEIINALRKRFELSDDAIETIASCARGSIGTAIRIASDPEFMEERLALLHTLRNWLKGPPILTLQTAELLRDMARPPKNNTEKETTAGNLNAILDHILSWYADLLSIKIRRSDSAITNTDFTDELVPLAQRYSKIRLQSAIRLIMETQRYLEGNITPQLALENMLFGLRPDTENKVTG